MGVKVIDIANQTIQENSDLQALIVQLEENCHSGFALAVIQDGYVQAKHYYGLADVTHHVPVTAQTKFPIASISKIYTSLLVLKLASDGLVDLNKPINHYVPDLAEAGQATVESVLSMTAGFCDAFEMFLIAGSGNLVTHSNQEHYLAQDIIAKENKSFKGDFVYSNSGYIFLAQLIEKVTGKTYEAVLKDVILDPLGLKNTDYFDGNWRVVDNLAVPNVHDGDNYVGRFYRNMAGAGHLAATLDDMVDFASALSKSEIAGIDIKTLMQRPKLLNGKPSFYGLGLQVLPVNGRRDIVGHNGSYYGIRTALFIEPKSNSIVVILSNSNDIDTVELSVDLLSAVNETSLSLVQKGAATDIEEEWLCTDTGLQVDIIKSQQRISKIRFYGDVRDLVQIGDNKYMVPYALSPIFLTVMSEDVCALSIGGMDYNLKPASDYDAAPRNLMEYVGRYKNPDSDIENFIKSDLKSGLFVQFGGAFSTVRDAPLEPLAKDYFKCTIKESNGAPSTLYVKFEREQFSQMISGYSIHMMRVPQLTFRRLKTV
tara:strand:+ start:66756 stop:68378 length:1623 start_codon:yes stop_codon:yes gene_type:complete